MANGRAAAGATLLDVIERLRSALEGGAITPDLIRWAIEELEFVRDYH